MSNREGQHGGIGEVVVDDVVINGWKGGANGIEIRKYQQRGKGKDDPRPRADRVVGKLKQENCAGRVPFTSSSEHSLGDLVPAAWFSAGIPNTPPLNCDQEDE